MAAEPVIVSSSLDIDAITKRPRTPNTQYTCLTDEQLENIQKVCHVLLIRHACVNAYVNGT